ncbi:MAG: hypothetical protein IT370_30245 [Deltaproteobacteria bacterium]|nr:hypothetical protein [Deltaproteobacteria bacterium]
MRAALALLAIACLGCDAASPPAPAAHGHAAAPACADEPTLLRTLEFRWLEYQADYAAARLAAVYDSLDQLVTAHLCAAPALPTAALAAWMRTLPHLEPRPHAPTDAVPLRAGERLLLWRGLGTPIWGGGRATALARRHGVWTVVGHVEFSECSELELLGARPDGVAILRSSGCGNGAPPADLVALAVDDDDDGDGEALLVHEQRDLPEVTLDQRGRLRIARRAAHIDFYPAAPLLEFAVSIRRAHHSLAVKERLLTPWAAALDALCGHDFSVVTPRLRGRLVGCAGSFTDAIRVRHRSVEVDLDIHEQPDPAADPPWSEAHPATLTLRPVRGRWMIVAMRAR